MKLAIMQPYVFPYIGYFQLINAVDKFVLYDDVNFIKQGWNNRNNILLNDKAYLFTVPLKNQSSFKKINRTEIDNKLYIVWRNKFFKTIDQAYKKAPFFNNALELLNKVFLDNEVLFISDLASKSINEVCIFLDLKTEIVETSSIYLNQDLKGEQRVLHICKKERANVYINPIGGAGLYSKENFKKNDIYLQFIKSKPWGYKQYNNVFVPSLSIIDVIMFNSQNEIRTLLKEYELL